MTKPATSSRTQRALIAALVLATAGAPAAVAITHAKAPATSVATCTGGEEEDQFTTTCVPFLVPNSPDGMTTTAANPDVPEIDGIPCTGRDSGACIGLADEQADMGPQPVPRSTISSSP
jgi:hypothetical protein